MDTSCEWCGSAADAELCADCAAVRKEVLAQRRQDHSARRRAVALYRAYWGHAPDETPPDPTRHYCFGTSLMLDAAGLNYIKKLRSSGLATWQIAERLGYCTDAVRLAMSRGE